MDQTVKPMSHQFATPLDDNGEMKTNFDWLRSNLVHFAAIKTLKPPTCRAIQELTPLPA
jgi:hypothetical protein